MEYQIVIDAFFISPQHNYFGQKDKAPASHPTFIPQSIECIAESGIVGDRFFAIKPDFDGQVTFMNSEVVDAIAQIQGGDKTVQAENFRRNIMISGISVIELIGEVFCIGDVYFEGVKHCAPCHWMDVVMGKGTMRAMKGRGGLRARVLSSGSLTLGETTLICEKKLQYDPIQSIVRAKIPG